GVTKPAAGNQLVPRVFGEQVAEASGQILCPTQQWPRSPILASELVERDRDEAVQRRVPARGGGHSRRCGDGHLDAGTAVGATVSPAVRAPIGTAVLAPIGTAVRRTAGSAVAAGRVRATVGRALAAAVGTAVSATVGAA